MNVECTRKNGRLMDQMRNFNVEFGLLKNADGSALVSLCDSKILVSVHGPIAAKSKQELIDRAGIEVKLESLSSAPCNN
jgi:ribonuclease PH